MISHCIGIEIGLQPSDRTLMPFIDDPIYPPDQKLIL